MNLAIEPIRGHTAEREKKEKESGLDALGVVVRVSLCLFGLDLLDVRLEVADVLWSPESEGG